ncbi:ovochymase-1-like isoform X2 [Mya arenaria]|uniref:ovochymase-1-like isoform X2 n=1 Tax=Mya arenaria TaxID=6604 RepID=UPI0022E70CC5|nr:ovochymase-1-like isoform X2 [Mya arenaria]
MWTLNILFCGILCLSVKDENTPCKTTLDASVPGTISSPGYGNGTYPPNTICSWILVAPQGMHVMIQFNNFSLENTRRCFHDYVRIYDGTDTISAPLGNYCGRAIPSDVISSGDTMLIIFKTDGVTEYSGFSVMYSIYQIPLPPTEVWRDDGCHGTVQVFTEHRGSISSPGYDGQSYYKNNQNCSWRIQAPDNMIIRLMFQDFLTEKIAGCTYDYLAVYDGPDRGSLLLDRKCGIQFPDDMFSSRNELYLVFVSDADLSSIGFNLTYEFVSAVATCGMFRCGDGSCILKQMVCNGVQECPDRSDELLCDSSNSTCGVPEVAPSLMSHRIVGGREAVAHSWPWVVSLAVNGYHQCGGAIVHPLWIITAAHCFEANRHTLEWTVVAGKHQKTKPENGTQTRAAERIVVNSGYNYITTENDIALVRLQEPLTFNSHVQAVCLPVRPPTDGESGVVAGWGEVLGTCCPEVLKQVELPVVPRATCTQSDHLGPQVTANMFCAGYEAGGEDACQGDSGGPFMVRDGGRWRLQGITSFGSLCAAPKSPGVYTNVFSYIDWIHQKIAMD